MSRWLAVDYGKRRIGLAMSDPGERIASPLTTLEATGSAPEDARLILELARQNDAAGIVIGLPVNMDGSIGPQAKLSQDLAERIRREGQLPVELWDERLSTFQADELMRAANLSPDRRRRHRDALAAQVILQSFLDARR